MQGTQAEGLRDHKPLQTAGVVRCHMQWCDVASHGSVPGVDAAG